MKTRGQRGRAADTTRNNELQKIPGWVQPKDLAGAKGAILSLGRSMHEHAYLIGKTLVWVKKQVGHGHLGAWVAANVWFGPRTAQRFMKFAEKCDKQSGLLDYSPGSKNDIMTELEEPGTGMSGLAMRVVHGGEHNRIRILLSQMYSLNDELTELCRAGSPVNDGSAEYPRRLLDRIREFDRLIGGEDKNDNWIAGAIPTTARDIIREYGLFLSSLDRAARRAFQDFELAISGAFDDGDGGAVIRDWLRKAPDIDGKRLEVGIELAICCIGIGQQFAGSSSMQSEIFSSARVIA